ncbi:MAG: histidinol-phosphate aminotransferase family protein [Synergistales bacterium]|nr:histidinol-phosphate aminotransferase family protein [Synergistales bacterium]
MIKFSRRIFMAILLDKNENPFEMSLEIKKAVMEEISRLFFSRYPDPDYRILREKLGALAGLPGDVVIPGNGGDEILWMVFSCFVRPGDTVLGFSPTFSEYYRLAELFGARFTTVPIGLEGDEPDFNFSLFLETIEREKPTVVLLDTPNNPTGKTLPVPFLNEVLSSAGNSIVLIDEAYGEFASETYLESIRGKKVPPGAIVLKTLSKAWGLAGIRLGWAYCGSVSLDKMKKARSPFNVNIFSRTVAEIVLDHPGEARSSSIRIKELREYVRNRINGMKGWRAFNGQGNFLLLSIPRPEDCVRSAAGEQFAFKYMDLTPGIKETRSWIRLTIGREDEMKEALRFFASL